MVSDNKKRKFEAGDVFSKYGWPGTPKLAANLKGGLVTQAEVDRAIKIAEEGGADLSEFKRNTQKLERKRRSLPYDQVSNLLGMKEKYEELGDEESAKAIDQALEQRKMLPVEDRREEVLMNNAVNIRKRIEEAKNKEDEQQERQPMVFGAMEGQDTQNEEDYIRSEQERSKEARKKALQRMRGY